MSVTTTATFITYNADGSTVTWAVPFYFINPSDLLVQRLDNSTGIVTQYNLTTDYNVTGTPDVFGDYNNGGNVVFNVAPPTNGILLISRQTQRTQSIVFTDFGAFTADNFNHAFDKLTLISQEIVIPGFRGLALGPPTTNVGIAYNAGDWLKNASPVAGGAWGWITPLGGTPGLWYDFAPISTT